MRTQAEPQDVRVERNIAEWVPEIFAVEAIGFERLYFRSEVQEGAVTVEMVEAPR